VARAAKISRRSFETQAADLLRERILSGALRNGARLTETALADELGLSRGPIRAALQQLVSEQLVTQKPYSGWEVRRLAQADVWELVTLRRSFEKLAARLAAEQIDAVGAARLRAALQRLKAACKSGRPRAVTDADFELHRTIIELAEHGRLRQQYLLLEQQVRMFISAVNAGIADPESIVRCHDALVEAICRGDARVAEHLSEEHNEIIDAAMLQGAESLSPGGESGA
jgi:DNA-binding GntR family transcriptional regulator